MSGTTKVEIYMTNAQIALTLNAVNRQISRYKKVLAESFNTYHIDSYNYKIEELTSVRNQLKRKLTGVME